MRRLLSMIIYTDGSARKHISSNAFYIPELDVKSVESNMLTNQYNELRAIERALLYIQDKYTGDVTIVTDSMYSINSLCHWCHGWIANGWINTSGEPVKNKDVILSILKINMEVYFRHVKAHQPLSDDPDVIGNHIADQLCKEV